MYYSCYLQYSPIRVVRLSLLKTISTTHITLLLRWSLLKIRITYLYYIGVARWLLSKIKDVKLTVLALKINKIFVFKSVLYTDQPLIYGQKILGLENVSLNLTKSLSFVFVFTFLLFLTVEETQVCCTKIKSNYKKIRVKINNIND